MERYRPPPALPGRNCLLTRGVCFGFRYIGILRLPHPPRECPTPEPSRRTHRSTERIQRATLEKQADREDGVRALTLIAPGHAPIGGAPGGIACNRDASVGAMERTGKRRASTARRLERTVLSLQAIRTATEVMFLSCNRIVLSNEEIASSIEVTHRYHEAIDCHHAAMRATTARTHGCHAETIGITV